MKVPAGVRLLPLFAVGCIAAAAACSKPTPVFLLTVDTLRADHLGVYGYGRGTSPNIDALARDSTVFDRCFTVRGRTTPSYASMMTGLYPYKHGVTSLGLGLPEANTTLAEALGSAGYENVGFVSSTVMIGRLSGLDRGFSLWSDHMPDREANRANYERTADETVKEAVVWLAEAKPKSFLFLHLIDPHSPYTPPAPFDSRFSGGSTKVINNDQVHSAARLRGKTTLGEYVSAYDGEIAFADAELGRLIAALKVAGRYDDALIIFTADHGESLGDHGRYFRHGLHLHDDTMRVPMIVKPPKKAGRVRPRWPGAVSVVDVFATALDYAGVSLSPTSAKVDSPVELDGVSLRGVVEGRVAEVGRTVFSSTRNGSDKDWGAHNGSGTLIADGCRQRGDLSTCRSRYYDSLSDPSHLRPLSSGDAYERSASPLRDFMRRVATHRRGFAPKRLYQPSDKSFVEEFVREHNSGFEGPTPEDLENLRSLGYL